MLRDELSLGVVTNDKTDLALYVGASLEVMERDARRMRQGGPFVFAQATRDVGVRDVREHILCARREALKT
jgi:urease accessory protein